MSTEVLPTASEYSWATAPTVPLPRFVPKRAGGLERLSGAFVEEERRPKMEPAQLRRRIRTGFLVGYLAVATILTPVAGITEGYAKQADAAVVRLEESIKTDNQTALDAAQSGATVLGAAHTPQELADAQADAANMHARHNGLAEVDELLLGAAGLQVAAGAAVGTWRRRKSIAHGVRTAASAVAGAARSTWTVLKASLSTAYTEPQAAAPADLFVGELQHFGVPEDLDSALTVGF